MHNPLLCYVKAIVERIHPIVREPRVSNNCIFINKKMEKLK